MRVNVNFNNYRKSSLVAGTLLMFFFIEMTRHSFSWLLGLAISIGLGLLLSFVVENGWTLFTIKKGGAS
ncbi:hypothetical protein [Enterococcus sp. AZ109]|uniref:hypothetical protein n=1 Tax=Enterococcus sp. AZ109 TaxID=2774634 RepID=UPI003F29C1A7